jgi:hypothetical protein
LHVEQAGVVALWRFAEEVGLEPEPLVAVLRTYWPNRALGVGAIVPSTPGLAMPVVRLALAEQLLGRMAAPDQLTSSNSSIGLSPSTRTSLSAVSETAIIAVASLGTSRARRPRIAATSTRQPRASSVPKVAKSSTKEVTAATKVNKTSKAAVARTKKVTSGATARPKPAATVAPGQLASPVEEIVVETPFIETPFAEAPVVEVAVDEVAVDEVAVDDVVVDDVVVDDVVVEVAVETERANEVASLEDLVEPESIVVADVAVIDEIVAEPEVAEPEVAEPEVVVPAVDDITMAHPVVSLAGDEIPDDAVTAEATEETSDAATAAPDGAPLDARVPAPERVVTPKSPSLSFPTAATATAWVEKMLMPKAPNGKTKASTEGEAQPLGVLGTGITTKDLGDKLRRAGRMAKVIAERFGVERNEDDLGAGPSK